MTPKKPTQECSDPSIGTLLVSYALGTLADAEAERFEQHLLHCPACQQELEEAAPALETLATTREEFVARAHRENEDFESQYERLLREKRTAARGEKTAGSRGWLESLWAIAWGRRWIVGTAGTVAFAVLIGLRYGLEPTSPPPAKEGTPVAPRQASVRTTDSLPTTPTASEDNIPEMEDKKRYDITSVPMQPSPSKKRSVEIPATLADRTIKLEPAKKAPVVTVETEADRIEEPAEIGIEESLPMATGVELHAQASVVAHKGVVRDSLSSAERSHFADVTLGKFDPERYRDLILESETGFAAATPESSATRSVKADRVSAEVRPRTDTVRAKLYHDESLNAAEQRGKTDSTEVRKQIMTGIAALARGDHEQAQTSLGLAYHRLPPGALGDDVGLLFARANIQAGRFDEAKSRLQNLATIGSDPERRKLAQQAIAKLDSLRAIPPPDPAPK